jgi:hypothetical protein
MQVGSDGIVEKLKRNEDSMKIPFKILEMLRDSLTLFGFATATSSAPKYMALIG